MSLQLVSDRGWRVGVIQSYPLAYGWGTCDFGGAAVCVAGRKMSVCIVVILAAVVVVLVSLFVNGNRLAGLE